MTHRAQAPTVPVRAETDPRLGDWLRFIPSYSIEPTTSDPAALRVPEIVQVGATTGDFDEDGVDDLVLLGRISQQVAVTLYRGNIHKLWPNTAAAREERSRSRLASQPFLAPTLAGALSLSPDLVAALDFDADGHLDLVAARRTGRRLAFLRGDGRGSFAKESFVELAGQIDTLVAGEIHRRDGLDDLVVGISDDSGSSLLVFQSRDGAKAAQPGKIPLPAAANEIILGHIDRVLGLDMVVAAGHDLLLVQGVNSLPPPLAALPEPRIETRSFPFFIQSVSLGDFIWEPEHLNELALLSDEGETIILQNESAGGYRTSELKDLVAPAGWFQAARVNLTTRSPAVSPQARLLRTRISSLPTDEIVVIDPGRDEMELLLGDPSQWSLERPEARVPSTPGWGKTARLALPSAPLAVLPMRLNTDALDDLVILSGAETGIHVIETAGATTFVVNLSGPQNDADSLDGLCDTDKQAAGSQCTLAAAMSQANFIAGTTTILFDVASAQAPESGLPNLVNPVVMDGTSQGRVEISGDGIRGSGGNSVFRGLVVNDDFLDEGFLGASGSAGVSLDDNGNNIVEGNFFGTDRAGLNAKPLLAGVDIFNSPNNLIGGTTAEARNLISGNGGEGLGIAGSPSVNNRIMGNYIGTDITGQTPLPNHIFGVGTGCETTDGINECATDNFIENNVISANREFLPEILPLSGIGLILGDGNLVRGNKVGVAADGAAPMTNVMMGVIIGGSGNTIRSNIIAWNGAEGVAVINGEEGVDATSNWITENSIHNNFKLGIDLSTGFPFDGVTPGDIGDVDTGPNNLQNAPALTIVEDDQIMVTLSSRPSTPYEVEFFSNTVCDASGFGEGEEFLASMMVTTDTMGVVTFMAPVQSFPDRAVTATATDPEGNTSEFSECAEQGGVAARTEAYPRTQPL